MDTKAARKLMRKYASALAYIEIEKEDGTKGVGSCFHVGDGVFVTARHVVEDNTISKVEITEPVAVLTKEFFPGISDVRAKEYDKTVGEILGTTPKFKHFQPTLTVAEGPFYHPEPMVDVAVFRVTSVHPETGVVPLGTHLDDWLDRFDWQLSEAIVLGYPPIPLTLEPHLVATRAEVNAIVDLHSSRHVHFILSATPRGGFSGGLALSEYDFALGVVTQSLVRDHLQEESGFFAVLSIEPIYQCLSHHKLLPLVQKEGWDDFWNTYSVYYVHKKRNEKESSQLIVSLEMIEDGEKIGVGVCSYNKSLFLKMDELIKNTLTGKYSEIVVHDTFYKYMYDSFTEEIMAEIRGLLLKLMDVCIQNELVAIHDQLTPQLRINKGNNT